MMRVFCKAHHGQSRRHRRRGDDGHVGAGLCIGIGIGGGGVGVDAAIAGQLLEAVSEQAVQAALLAGEQAVKARETVRPAVEKQLEEARCDAAASWSRVERIIARVEAGPRGCDARFIVTSLTRGTGKTLYEGVYCARGQAENHIKAWKTHLAADRTSCTSAAANQLRLFLHAGADWMMWTLRAALPKRSPWRRAQFDTLRLRLIKIAARVVEMKTRITVHLPSACPAAPLMRLLLERLPRMTPI